jgi:hypothetical protein
MLLMLCFLVMLCRLARDMRGLKDKVGDGLIGALQRNPDSDHAMLSGKPLMGYR